MNTFDRTDRGTEPLRFITLNNSQLYMLQHIRTKGSIRFCQLVVFVLVNLGSHANLASQPYKNLKFPFSAPVFSSNATQIKFVYKTDTP